MCDNKPLLSITIPTYNRVQYLGVLLDSIFSQVEKHKDKLEIIVCDNASVDNTGQVVEHFIAQFPSAKYIRNNENIGMDGNFKKCFDSANGTYVWMIGDDDRLAPNALDSVFDVLNNEPDIDLLYLSSRIKETNTEESANYITLTSRDDFIRHTGVMFTFISGMICNKSAFTGYPVEKHVSLDSGTFLLHLHWQLCLLKNGERFAIIKNTVVYATPDNSGGYRLFTVFSKNLSFLVDKFFPRNNYVSKRLRLSSALFLLNFLNNSEKTKEFEMTEYINDCDMAFGDLALYRYLLRFFYINPSSVKFVMKTKKLIKKLLRR